MRRRSAPVVAAADAAGAVLIGKTNLDQFATGLVGARTPYGAVRRVYNRAWVSGGSSSGSAVAVAAGLVAFALGTDTAGSGRVPAAFNHLVGLKPTKGRWSTRGVVPACRSLDCVSVLASPPPRPRWWTTSSPASTRPIPIPAASHPRAPARSPRSACRGRTSSTGWATARRRVSIRQRSSGSARWACGWSRSTSPRCWTPPRCSTTGPWVAERTAAVEGLLRRQPRAIEPTVRAILQSGLAISAVDAFRGEYALRAHQRAAETSVGARRCAAAPDHRHDLPHPRGDGRAVRAQRQPRPLHQLREPARHERGRGSGRAFATTPPRSASASSARRGPTARCSTSPAATRRSPLCPRSRRSTSPARRSR